MAELTINTADITSALRKNIDEYSVSLDSSTVGRVLEVGADVRRFRAGDRVLRDVADVFRANLRAFDGAYRIGGGLPLEHQGQRVGGIGVSGGSEAQDCAFAAAAVAASDCSTLACGAWPTTCSVAGLTTS